MHKRNERTALITGASGGIGLELARLFARDGYRLVLVARSRDKLEEIAADFREKYEIRAVVLVKDLSEPSAPDEIYSELCGAGIKVDVLVNNAGFTVYGEFKETDLRTEQEMMQVNIIALTHLTKLFLPSMLERGWGRVLNVASLASFFPGPLMSVYYASKAYVRSFSEGLHEELVGTGVSVTALCPGLIATGFQSRGDMEGSRLMFGRKLPGAGGAARSGYRALMRGQVVIVPGVFSWLMAQATRFVPRWLLRKFVHQAQMSMVG